MAVMQLAEKVIHTGRLTLFAMMEKMVRALIDRETFDPNTARFT